MTCCSTAGWHVGVLRENLGFLSPDELGDLAQALHQVAGEALSELGRRAEAGVQ
jgi:hypothetical protein